MSPIPRPELVQRMNELSNKIADIAVGTPRAIVAGAAMAVAFDAAEQASTPLELLALRNVFAKGLAHLDTLIAKKTS